MYIETVSTRRGGKIYKCILLRESFRKGGKVKHRTIANLTNRPDDEISAIRFALQHKGQLPDDAAILDKGDLDCEQGFSKAIRKFFSDDIPKMLDVLEKRINDNFQRIVLNSVVIAAA